MHHFFAKRKENSYSYPVINRILLAIFPVFIVLLSEFNHLQSFSALWEFIVGDFSVFIFDTILVGIILLVLLFITKRGFLSTFSIGLFLFVISFVEFYKYQSSGAHFALSDLVMAGNISQLSAFAGIQLNGYLAADVLLFLCYFAAVYWFNPKPFIHSKKAKRFAAAAISVLLVCAIVATPFSNQVYTVFALDTDRATNLYSLDEKFETNNLIASLAQDSSEQILNAPTEPEGYSSRSIRGQMEEASSATTSIKPNVVMIMSESFADFRQLDHMDGLDRYYTSFDYLAKKGELGRSVVPTFGNTTVRTESELMFGVPTLSLNNSASPQRMLADRQEDSQPTFASYFNHEGYRTTYIHPFSDTFYGRDQYYANYGFDQLLYQEQLEQEAVYYRQYISDQTCFNKVVDLLEESDQPDYIFLSTMQNHQPYSGDGGQSEFEYYLDGLEQTNLALENLIQELEELEEPTIVLFVGDHYPYFVDSSESYDLAGIDEDNAYQLYQQPYIVWNNYGLEIDLPELVSAFYLPHLVAEYTGLEQTPFIATMLDEMEQTPVYSSNAETAVNANQRLDEITYDRILGELYSRY